MTLVAQGLVRAPTVVGASRLRVKETGWKNMNWIGLPWDRAEWQALVDTAMNIKFHKMWDVS